jgi:hypothetical protein
MGHTPLSPGKNRARRNWVETVPLTKDIITISPALFEVLDIRRHQGMIVACDIDPVVHSRILHIRKGNDYPDLHIGAPGWSIQETVLAYCKNHGVRNLGAVDVDLYRTLDYELPILKEVLSILAAHKYKGKVLFTFRNGRDSYGKGGSERRICRLIGSLPKGFEYVRDERYRSDCYGRFLQRKIGSSMVIVELQGKP